MHFALFQEFRCRGRIARLSDNRGKTQYITMQKFRSLALSVRWRGCPIKGGPINGELPAIFLYSLSAILLPFCIHGSQHLFTVSK